jgi:hypothetical protein
VRSTVASSYNRLEGLPTGAENYNMAGIFREVVYSRGSGYGWGIEHDAAKFEAVVRANVRKKNP